MSLCVDNLSIELTESRLDSLLIEYDSVKQIHLPSEHQIDRGSGLAALEMRTATKEEEVPEILHEAQWRGCSIALNQSNYSLQMQDAFESEHSCPCCSSTLLRHIRLRGIYWRCNHCHQEMPIL